jgi:hypothetical protein
MDPDPLDRVHGQDAGWGAAPPQKRLQQKKEQQAFRRIHLLHLHTRQVWVEDSAWGADAAEVGDAVAVLAVDSTADNRSETMIGKVLFPKCTFFQR